MKFHNALWQSHSWQKFQESVGNNTFWISDGEHQILGIVRRTAFGKKFFEIPRVNISLLSEEFWQQLTSKAQKEGAVFTRIFPAEQTSMPSEKGISILQTLNSLGVVVRTSDVPEIFPQHTLVLDLSCNAEELLQQMKPKGRYNIRLAEKKGVIVEQSTRVEAFYKLLEQTTTRDKFSGHPVEVYKKMLKSFGKDGFLLLAKYQDEYISGGIFLCHENTCTYYYGASSNSHRNLMAPYLVQWAAIQAAQKRGYQWYDFLGIAPKDKPHHRLNGVSNFKEKFGGIRTIYTPQFEVVHHVFWDRVIRGIKKIRSFLP